MTAVCLLSYYWTAVRLLNCCMSTELSFLKPCYSTQFCHSSLSAAEPLQVVLLTTSLLFRLSPLQRTCATDSFTCPWSFISSLMICFCLYNLAVWMYHHRKRVCVFFHLVCFYGLSNLELYHLFLFWLIFYCMFRPQLSVFVHRWTFIFIMRLFLSFNHYR